MMTDIGVKQILSPQQAQQLLTEIYGWFAEGFTVD
jgi:hypothetical protein